MRRTRALSLFLVLGIVVALVPCLSFPRHAIGDSSNVRSVYCIGDSLTAVGYYEAKLETLLGSSYIVVNHGVSGDTTSGMLSRFKTDVIGHDPDFVVIWGGVNDVAHAGLSLITIESNLQSMYTQAHDAGIKVIAISMSPWKDYVGWTIAKQALTNGLHDWIMNTATNADYRVEVYHALENGYTDCLLPAYDSGDHLHFNSTGGVVIGQAIYDAVDFSIPAAQPRNLAPDDGAVSVSRAPTLRSSAFSSSKADDAHVASQWQIRESLGYYTYPVFDSGIDTTNLTSIAAPTLGYSTYYWHVRYQSSNGAWSVWSLETSFSISSAPGQPTAVQPIGGASCPTLTPALVGSVFSDAGEGDSHAASQWQMTTTAGDYSTLILDSAADTAHLSSITVPRGALSNHETYYWRVRYRDNHGVWSDWSAEAFFTTAVKGGRPFWSWAIIGVAAVLIVATAAYLRRLFRQG
jgi:acyl-CoA thioesterase-1